MKDTTEVNEEPSMATAVINYMLNRFMPFICVLGILIYTCGYDSLVPYAVLGFMWFTSKFSFDCGEASAILEHGLNSYGAMILVEDDEEEIETTERIKKEGK